MTLIPFLMLCVTSAFSGQIYHGKVLALSDGDTIHFQAEKEPKKFKVRMIAIDTAELHLSTPDGKQVSQGYWAEQGDAELKSYLSIGDNVSLEVYGEDVHGRKLGKVIKNGEDINLKMIKSGWASLYALCEQGAKCVTGNLSAKDFELYRKACKEAVQNERGLFDRLNPVPELAFVFRAKQSGKPLSKFVANVANRKYVAPAQYDSVEVCDRLFYFTEPDAVNNGFYP